ncbi:MAG: cyanophycinase [Treponema sp.]|jgi:cyanophycinase|nr:cyanophycinase [Treponema sp.]
MKIWKQYIGIFAVITFVFTFTTCDLFNNNENCEHIWQWIETTAPTETEAAIETYTCTKCGEKNGTRGGRPATGSNGNNGHLFIHGGATNHMNQRTRFSNLAGGSNAKILVVPFASDNPEEQGPSSVESLIGRGINADYVAFKKGEADLPENLNKLDGITGIWIPGGSQSRLMDILLGTVFLERIQELYRNGGVIGGSSAGAAVMSKVMIANDSGGIPNIAEGFGLIDFAIIDQHFSERNRQGRLIHAVQEHNLLGIGIDEGTAVFYNSATLTFEVMGEGSVTVYEHQPTGINTQIFYHGDRFTGIPLNDGRMSFQKQSALPPGINYEDFLGTYTMHYSNNPSNPDGNRSLTVAIVQAVHGESYHLKGLLQDDDEALGTIEVLFDAYRGLEIPGNKILFTRPDNIEFWLMTVLESGSNQRLSRPNAGLTGTDYKLINGKINFSTTCRNIGSYYSIGFLFRNFVQGTSTSAGNVNHKGGEYRWYYPRFEKL